MYLVSYKSATRPTDLPDDATVERIAREFPFEMSVYGRRPILTEKSLLSNYTAFLRVDEGTVHLTTHETRELAHALLELIGDDVPDTTPTHVIDGEGDHWRLHSNGKYFCTGTRDRDVKSYDTGESTLEQISRNYSGYTVVK